MKGAYGLDYGMQVDGQTIAPVHPILQYKDTQKDSTLLLIFNLSLSTGSFPTAYRHGHIIPTLKEPLLDPSIPANYYPVSPSALCG